MSYKVDNAVIMAAGTSSRFAPLSYEKPKALIEVKGEVLIERQIRQLREVGIREIIVVVGYQKEKFQYLKDKYDIMLVENNDYLKRNNNASIYVVQNYLQNTYVCSADNYFSVNPFESVVEDSYYAGVYADGPTNEWCMEEDSNGYICNMKIGGEASWYMLGHTFWNKEFSNTFISILNKEYENPRTYNLLWESIYMEHLDLLKMKIRKYDSNVIFEFDTLDELRKFDKSYIDDTRSSILNKIANTLGCKEGEIVNVNSYKGQDNAAEGFTFEYAAKQYRYHYKNKELKRIS